MNRWLSIFFAVALISMFACQKDASIVETDIGIDDRSLITLPFAYVDATLEEIYHYRGEPTAELMLSPTFKQLTYKDEFWQGMQGNLIFYLEDDRIRSITFVPESVINAKEMDEKMSTLYANNREEQVALLMQWYERDAKESWFRDQIVDVDLSLGAKVDHYWLYDTLEKNNWVIATHNGIYPYEFIAFIPQDRFHFGLSDYMIE